VERRKGKRYSSELRRQAVERMNACGNIVGLARELGVSRRVLYQWRDRMELTDSSAREVPRANPAQANSQAQAIASK
jgi:transposase-like protein